MKYVKNAKKDDAEDDKAQDAPTSQKAAKLLKDEKDFGMLYTSSLMSDILDVQFETCKRMEGTFTRITAMDSQVPACLDKLRAMRETGPEGLIKGGTNLQHFYNELFQSKGLKYGGEEVIYGLSNISTFDEA